MFYAPLNLKTQAGYEQFQHFSPFWKPLFIASQGQISLKHLLEEPILALNMLLVLDFQCHHRFEEIRHMIQLEASTLAADDLQELFDEIAALQPEAMPYYLYLPLISPYFPPRSAFHELQNACRKPLKGFRKPLIARGAREVGPRHEATARSPWHRARGVSRGSGWAWLDQKSEGHEGLMESGKTSASARPTRISWLTRLLRECDHCYCYYGHCYLFNLTIVYIAALQNI